MRSDFSLNNVRKGVCKEETNSEKTKTTLGKSDILYSFGLDLSGFKLATFHIGEKVLRTCLSREGSQNTFFILGHKKKGRPFLNVRVFEFTKKHKKRKKQLHV